VYNPSSGPNTGSCLVSQEIVMEHEGQFPCPQESDNDRYPKPDKSHPIYLRSSLILFSRLHLPSGIFQLRFTTKIVMHFFLRPIAVAARSKARTVFARSNTEIVSSNPTGGMDVCVCSVCVYSVPT
jgi:hypothetical protein